MTKLTLGCDPEFYLYDTEKLMSISAHEFIPGTKEHPNPLPNGGSCQLDGIAGEFNIEPAATVQEWSDNIRSVLNDIRKMVPARYKMMFHPTTRFTKPYFDSIPDELKVLGCNPDFTVNLDTFALEQNNPPEIPGGYETMRTFSGHIHFGWTQDQDVTDKSHLMDVALIIAAADATWTTMSHNFEPYSDRQMFYGRPRCVRPKPYGCEYRTPSCAWLGTKELWPFIFHVFSNVFYSMIEGSFKNPVGNGVYLDSGSKLNTNAWFKKVFGHDMPADLVMPKGFTNLHAHSSKGYEAY